MADWIKEIQYDEGRIMKVRILTGLCIAALGIPLLIFSHLIIYPIVLAALSLIALYEFYRVMRVEKNLALTIPTYLIGMAFPILAYFLSGEGMKSLHILSYITLALFVYMFYAFFVAVLNHHKQNMSSVDVMKCFFVTAFITLSFTSLSIIRYIPNGSYFIALVFIASWATDIFAYFFGSFFGKHKLAPVVSPKKSIEGAIAGTVGCTLCFVLYGYIVVTFFGAPSANYLYLALSGVILSIIAQIGDLSCSLVKREYGVKDYGNIFPGHGGVVDRFDSVIAVSTILMVICTFFPPIG